MYVSGFDGRGVQLVWEALFCEFGEGLGSLPVLTTYRLLPWPCRLPDWEPMPECSAHALWRNCPMVSMAVPLLPIEFVTFGGGELISIITSVAVFWLMLGFAVCRWEERLNCDLTGSDCQYHSPCGLMSKLAWPETAVSTAVLLFQIPTRVPCVSKALCLAP